MKIHLKQIPPQGLHLDGDEDCPLQNLEAEGIRCAGQLHYSIDLGIAGGALWARGSLSQPVDTELHGPDTVDLTPFMREDLLLNLPAHPRCDRDGNRVCKGEKPETAKEDLKRKPDWSALDKLKLNR